MDGFTLSLLNDFVRMRFAYAMRRPDKEKEQCAGVLLLR